MLPEFLSGEGWLQVFDHYGYAKDPAEDPDETYLWAVGKNPGPHPGFDFAASEFAQVEVALVIEFVTERLDFDEEEFVHCIEVICTRNGWTAD